MIRLSPVWSNGAVLQHGQALCLRGQTAPHLQLFGKLFSCQHQFSFATHSDNNGDFSTTLAAQEASGPWTLTICSATSVLIELTDLWFGQLILFAGQSNVGWPLAHDPQQCETARLELQSGRPVSVRGYLSDPADFRAAGHWHNLSAENCADWPALLFYFSQYYPALSQTPDTMLGLVDLSWPGSAVAAWTESPSGEFADKPWQDGALFAARLAPWLRPPFCALVWYQGEQDAMGQAAANYYDKLQRFFTGCWRITDAEFPLLLVQIAGFGRTAAADPTPLANGFVQVRMAQQQLASQLTKCSLVSAADLGNATDIHPPYKAELARRLVLAAAGLSPRQLAPAQLQRSAGQTWLKLPVLPPGDFWQVHATDNAVHGFYCQGADNLWTAVSAQLHAELGLVQLQLPAATRQLAYGLASMPTMTLFTAQGLPLLPQLWPLPDEAR